MLKSFPLTNSCLGLCPTLFKELRGHIINVCLSIMTPLSQNHLPWGPGELCNGWGSDRSLHSHLWFLESHEFNDFQVRNARFRTAYATGCRAAMTAVPTHAGNKYTQWRETVSAGFVCNMSTWHGLTFLFAFPKFAPRVLREVRLWRWDCWNAVLHSGMS